MRPGFEHASVSTLPVARFLVRTAIRLPDHTSKSCENTTAARVFSHPWRTGPSYVQAMNEEDPKVSKPSAEGEPSFEQALARLESIVALQELFARYPSIQRADDTLNRVNAMLLRGLKSLPLVVRSDSAAHRPLVRETV